MKQFAHNNNSTPLRYIKCFRFPLFLATSLMLFSLTLNIITATSVYAQADYMAPGVPYKANCYITNKLKFNIELKAPATLQVNQTGTAQIFIKNPNSKDVKVKNISLKIQYNKNYLQIKNVYINKNICNNPSSNLVNNSTQNGTLYVTLPENSCGTINMPANSITELLSFKFIAIAQGTGYLKIDTQDTTNGSKIALASPTAGQANLQGQGQLDISIIQAGQTTLTATPNATQHQTTTTPPNTGILNDQDILILVIAILIIGIIVQFIPIEHKIKPIEYVEQ